MELTVCAITATANRHTQLERVVRCMKDQDYKGKFYHLIFNNSCIPQNLDEELEKDKFILINNCLDTRTNKKYNTLGDIYQDLLQFIPEDVDLITFADDDDLYLPNHITKGVEGYLKGGLKAYKPIKSWFKTQGGKLELVNNTLEPSIFVELKHVKDKGFSPETTAQHLQWVNPLVYDQEIFVDPDGTPTYICDWSQEIATFKTSGDPNNPNNFNNYHNWSSRNNSEDDRIITPSKPLTWTI